MFDKELFYSLCEKYSVELSDEYDKPMIWDEKEVREILPSDVKHIFDNALSYFSYNNRDNIQTIIEEMVVYDTEEDVLLATAC